MPNRNLMNIMQELDDLRTRNDELESMLIECKRAVDANTDIKSLYEVAQDLIELKRAEDALKKERDYFKNVLDNSADAIGIVDAKGRFIRWNKRAEELFGYSFQELRGKSAFDLYADKAELQAMLTVLRRDGYVRDTEISIRTKSGHILPLGMSISLLREDDRTIGSVCVARDLTQIKKTQVALQKSKEEAEAANRAKSEFLANMTHEIRTPMNAILGFSEALLYKTEQEQNRRYLQTILSSGQTLLTLIDDILDLSKIEAGRLEIRPEPLDLRRLVKDVETIFEPSFDQKGLDFVVEISPQLPRGLVLDEVRIRQILVNLVGNALKFTAKGFVRLSVDCSPWSQAEQGRVDISFAVEDTGIGIPKEQHDVIFENFRQQNSQTTREYGGSGLGLAITQKLVSMMGGRISVASEVHQGSLFRILLPDIPTASHLPRESMSSAQACQLPPATILVVDDEPANIELVAGILESTPLRVVGAGSANEALEACEGRAPDLVFLDQRLPDLSGAQVADLIKKQNPELPVVAWSACALKDEQDILAEGFDASLLKPVTKNKVVAICSRFLSAQNRPPGQEVSRAKAKTDQDSSLDDALSGTARDRLRSAYGQRCTELSQALIMDEVEGLAAEIEAEAEDLQVPELSAWSRELQSRVQAFDVPGVRSMLSDFAQRIGKEGVKRV